MKKIINGPFKRFSMFLTKFFVFQCIWLFIATFSFADTITYQYDSLNRLTRIRYSSGTIIEYTYDATGNVLSKKVSLAAECEGCSSSPVQLTNVIFSAGTLCVCRDNNSITIGSGVTVESGADVTFIAPEISVEPGAKFVSGANVKIRQQ